MDQAIHIGLSAMALLMLLGGAGVAWAVWQRQYTYCLPSGLALTLGGGLLLLAVKMAPAVKPDGESHGILVEAGTLTALTPLPTTGRLPVQMQLQTTTGSFTVAGTVSATFGAPVVLEMSPGTGQAQVCLYDAVVQRAVCKPVVW